MVTLYTHSRICRTAMDVLTIKYCGLIKLLVLHCHWLVFLGFFFTFLYRIQCTVSNLNNDVTDDFPETSIGYYGTENISTVITFEKLLNFLLSEVYWKHFGLNSIIIYCNHKLFVST